MALLWTWVTTWLVMTLVVFLTLGDDSNVTHWGAAYYALIVGTWMVLTFWTLVFLGT